MIIHVRATMNRYDIVFMGNMCTATIVRFEGPTFIERGGPAFFGPLAASCLAKKMAVVTKMSNSEDPLMVPLKAAGVDLYLQPGETSEIRCVHHSANVDERQMFMTKRSGYFHVEDLPPIEPCLIHLGGLSDHEFSMEFIKSLKARGFRLSADMQSFIWHVDEQTREIQPEDIPEKREILRMLDFVKLDVSEAKALTGTDDVQKQAELLENMGSTETVITSSYGPLARSKGKNYFAKFTNKTVLGRAGRGDTFSGAYLARRLDHSIEDSLGFAAALTSIKIESAGPFNGSLEDVLERMLETSRP